MENKSQASGGIGFTGLLTIAFIVLKLCNVIAWSWLWVLSPIWISFGIIVLVLIGMGLYWWHKSIDQKRRLKSGMNEWAWKRRKNKNMPGSIEAPPLSKWEERLKEMQERKSKINNP
jgi:hypothetical protein